MAFPLGGLAADQFHPNERPRLLWRLVLPPVARVPTLTATIRYITMSEAEFDRRYNGAASE